MSCSCYAFPSGTFIGKNLLRGLHVLPPGTHEVVREATGYGFAGIFTVVKYDNNKIEITDAFFDEDETGEQVSWDADFDSLAEKLKEQYYGQEINKGQDVPQKQELH